LTNRTFKTPKRQ